jgi:alpha,alpha-trehalase
MNYTNNITSTVQASLAFFESELFKNVQMSSIFSDSKTFADAIPKFPIDVILTKYNLTLLNSENANLIAFVKDNFTMPELSEIVVEKGSLDINKQIDFLWQALKMPADQQQNSSLLALSKPYVVPGGRFREIYYWDSYFTALGLIESNQVDLVESMLENFVDLQTKYDCIPNGNRSYYLSRSQPPILGLLVELLLPYKEDKQSFLLKYISAIDSEYQFWMQGSIELTDSQSEHRRVVKMPDGSFLNRYWDDNDTPRPESYREDIELLHESNPENASEFYRNIRAACESGWDFSSRWLTDAQSLASIQTTKIIPVDLNCLLYKQERLLCEYYLALGEKEVSSTYLNHALRRKSAINRYMWSSKYRYFMDYDISAQSQSPVYSLAGVLPLFVKLANSNQAEEVSKAIENKFLQKGGLITTSIKSNQQWDAPNGWAPLHWFAVQGLTHYEYTSLAQTIKSRWLNTVEDYFEQTGKLMEKYNVCQQSDKAEGGEYDVQEGFGWTNGVYKAFVKK